MISFSRSLILWGSPDQILDQDSGLQKLYSGDHLVFKVLIFCGKFIEGRSLSEDRTKNRAWAETLIIS